jgi:ArsR family transcriptional regulator, arsenate/arsenite/antimonite-responsive transcriptional repressor
MDQIKAVDAFSALAQDTRLAIFRLLVREEPNGLKVGEISHRLDIVPSTLSGHLSILKRAGLLKSTRHQREIHYTADLGAMNNLVRFMLEDCCNGQVDNCSKILTLL